MRITRATVLAGVIGASVATAWTVFASTATPGIGLGVETTQRKVRGIITAVGDATVSIAPSHGQEAITGRVDGHRTRIAIDGKPAHLADLLVTHDATAELSLDDVWLSIRVSTGR